VKWVVSPLGVKGVLTKVVTAADGLTTAATGLETSVTSAAASAGTIDAGDYENGFALLPPGQYGPPSQRGAEGLVSAALAQFIQSNEQRLAYIAQRTVNSVTGAQNATNDYVQGDLEMAAQAQAEALKEPVLDLPGADGGKDGK